MLTPSDDLPLHQTADVMAFAGTDKNFYDRFFFNGYSPDGELFFAAALGVYPQLDIMDGSFNIRTGGKQYVARFSKQMRGDRMNLRIGAFSLEMTKLLEEVRVRLALSKEIPLSADLVFTGRHFPIEEPRFTRRLGVRGFMDYTRMTQNGVWSGEIKVEGERFRLPQGECFGTRDRSWGIRPVGKPDSQLPAGGGLTQFFWLWTPVNFDSHVAFFHSNDDEHGRAWNRRAVVQAIGGEVVEYDDIRYALRWREGGRRIDTLTCHLAGMAGEATLHYDCGEHFYMHGLGYGHPEWGHGMDNGAQAQRYEVMDLKETDDLRPDLLHIQSLATAKLEIDGKTLKGRGVVEQAFIGAHETTGLPEGLGAAGQG